MALNATRQSVSLLARREAAAPRDLPESQVWINVGLPSEDAEGEALFVGLPYGIPVDTMRRAPGRGDLAQAKNGLLDMIAELAETLEPGEEHILDLQVQIRRVAQRDNASSTTNPLLAAMGKINLVKG